MKGYGKTLKRASTRTCLPIGLCASRRRRLRVVPQRLGDRVDQIVGLIGGHDPSALNPIDGMSSSIPG